MSRTLAGSPNSESVYKRKDKIKTCTRVQIESKYF